jgi:hypothetical protein
VATVPVETTAVAGTVLTAATWNSNVRDALNFILARPLAVMYQTVTQSVTNGAWVGMLLDTEEIDRDNGHSTSVNTSRYTAQTAGWYDVDATTAWATNATSSRGCRLAVNGVSKPGRATYAMAVSNNATSVPVSGKVFLNVGDYVENQGAQNSTVTISTVALADLAPYMSVLWIST